MTTKKEIVSDSMNDMPSSVSFNVSSSLDNSTNALVITPESNFKKHLAKQCQTVSYTRDLFEYLDPFDRNLVETYHPSVSISSEEVIYRCKEETFKQPLICIGNPDEECPFDFVVVGVMITNHPLAHYRLIINDVMLEVCQNDGILEVYTNMIYSYMTKPALTKVKYYLLPTAKCYTSVIKEVKDVFNGKSYALGCFDCQTFVRTIIHQLTNLDFIVKIQSDGLFQLSSVEFSGVEIEVKKEDSNCVIS